MIRWQYVVPRAMVICLLGALVYFGSEPALHWTVIQSLQSVTGAKVEVERIGLDWSQGQLAVEQIHVANPNRDMENLFQADQCILDLDLKRLLHKEIVVESAQVNHIQFNTPRTRSGALDETERSSGIGPWLATRLQESASSQVENWLDGLQMRAVDEIESNSQTLQLIKQVEQQWRGRYEQQRQRVAAIQRKITTLRQLIKQPSRNPLRDIERVQQALKEMESLQNELKFARQELSELDKRFRQDQQSIQQAVHKDRKQLQDAVDYLRLDGRNASELLLGAEKAKYVQETMDWVRWFRNSIPDPERDFYPQRGRGENVVFAGWNPRPRFHIQTAELSGVGIIGGQRYLVEGTASDLSSQPDLLGEPTRFQLSAQGPKSISIDAVLDRRGDQPRDTFDFELPATEFPGRTLGTEDTLVLQVSPGQVQTSIHVEILDQTISGKVLVQSSGVRLSLQHLDQRFSDPMLVQGVNGRLADIDEFEFEISFSGNQESVSANLSSKLGNQVASAFGDAANQIVKANVQKQQQRFASIVEQEYNALQEKHVQELRSLLQLVDGDVRHIAELQKLLPQNSSSWPKIR